MATALGALSSPGCTINNCDEGSICLDQDHDDVSHECSRVCQRLADCGRIDQGDHGACVDACTEGFKRDDDALENYCECVPETSCKELNRECGGPPFTPPPPTPHDDGDDDGDDTGVTPHADAGAASDGAVDAGGALDAGAVSDSAVDAGGALDAGAEAGPHADAASDTGTAPEAGADAGPRPDAGPTPDASAGSCTCDDDCAASEGCLNGQCHARCAASCECRLGDVCQAGLCVTPPPASMSCENDCDCPAGNHCVATTCMPREAPLLQ
jgi:hypothetical protein